MFFSIHTTLLAEDLQPDKKGNTLIFPYASHSYDTSWVIGLIADQSLYNTFLLSDSMYLRASSQYSIKKQSTFELSGAYNTPNKNSSLKTTFAYKDWSSDFYGVGIKSSKNRKENYRLLKKEAELSYSKRALDKWSFGLFAFGGDYSVRDIKDAPMLSSGETIGSSGGLSTEVGVSIAFDSKNSHYFVTDGKHLKTKAYLSNGGVGSDFTYKGITVDYQHYYPITTKQSLVLQKFVGHESGGVPYQRMFQLGDYLRGYSRSRHIDKNISVLRGEYRIFPMTGKYLSRVGFVAFPELGTVFSSPDKLRLTDYKFSYGIGLRVRVFEGESPHLRIDIARTKESFNIILIGTEAF